MHRLNTISEGEMLVDEAELSITRSQYCDALDALRVGWLLIFLSYVGEYWHKTLTIKKGGGRSVENARSVVLGG